MAFYPYLTPTHQDRILTDAFYGYRHRLRIQDGAWYDMKNMSGEEFPVLSTRRKRGEVLSFGSLPQGLLAKDALAWVDGSTLYYNGYATQLNNLSVPDVRTTETRPAGAASGVYWLSPQGVTYKSLGDDTWAEVSYPHKHLVSMGAYLCVFPDKKYINTHDLTDYGSMEASWSAAVSGTVTFSLCNRDGESISAAVSSQPPENPANGDYWIDTSGSFDVLNRYSATSGAWAQVPTVYVKIGATGIGAGFSAGDGVTVSGCAAGEEGSKKRAQTEALNGSHILSACGDDYIVVEGILEDSTDTTQTGGVGVERTVPDMDFVCEAGNRLWGCYYGLKDGQTVNELYCCALGDFKNWSKYEGLSTDSWAASCGTDGQWTGAVNYFGSPTFFKEEHIHVITISAVGAHSVTDYAFEGVQKGSWESLAVVGSTLFYKSRNHVCAYQGGMPSVVSDDLGDVQYFEASGGAWGSLYYISMRSADGWNLFVFDAEKNMWHREDDLHAFSFAAADGDLYAAALIPSWGIDVYNGVVKKLLAMRGTLGTPEEDFSWQAQSGVMTLEYPDQKTVTRIDVRCSGTGSLTVRLDYLGVTGEPYSQEYTVAFDALGGRSRTFPLRVRRADTVVMTLEGTGEVQIVSVARIVEQGSDYNR